MSPIDAEGNYIADCKSTEYSPIPTPPIGWICPNCGKGKAPHVDSCCEKVTYGISITSDPWLSSTTIVSGDVVTPDTSSRLQQYMLRQLDRVASGDANTGKWSLSDPNGYKKE